MTRSKKALEALATEQQHVYKAAMPGYMRNFSRDSLTYGLLADDLDALKAQVAFSAKLQGVKADAHTGEEPGKIHHEFPGVEIRNLLTTYNGCDTTAIFLLAITRLAKRGQPEVLETYRGHIEKAVQYIEAHLHDGIFYEDTKQCGAERFALKVTYWKDSELNAVKKEPSYPVAYSLVHFQNKAALLEIGTLMHRDDWLETAALMGRRGLEAFWEDDHFILALEGDGNRLDAPSSDSLHSLLYIEAEEIPRAQVLAIERYSEQLATDGGYLPALQQLPAMDTYHTGFVWVHEQALLHAAAIRHKLPRAREVTLRIIPTLGEGFPELIDPAQNFAQAGNPTQLWSIGAYLYFERIEAEMTLSKQLQQYGARVPVGAVPENIGDV